MNVIYFGGDESLDKCGANLVTGVVLIWNVKKSFKPKKPDPKKYPGIPSHWLSGFKNNKKLKKFKKNIKKARDKWNKQEEKWKAARKKALKDIEKTAKSNSRTKAKEYVKGKIDKKSCTNPKCKHKEWDGNVNFKVKSGASSVSENQVIAWAYCECTATPMCKEKAADEKKEKDHGFYVPKKLDIPEEVAWQAVASESGLTLDEVTSEHSEDYYVWLDSKAEARRIATEPQSAILRAAERKSSKSAMSESTAG